MHMHRAELGATMQRRHALARIENSGRIEHALHRMKLLDLVRIELDAHLVELFHANPMLSRHRPAHLDAQLEDLAAELFGDMQLTRISGVIEDERMEVAVPRMKN